MSGVKYITKAQGKKLVDRHARRDMGISGEEFLRRYDAGEYRHMCCGSEEGRTVQRLVMLIPFARTVRVKP